jgi:chemotaxis protein MotB
MFIDETLAHTGHGGVSSPSSEANGAAAVAGGPEEIAAETEALQGIEEMLSGHSGESMVSDLARRHIVTELTDEGLVIEVFDIEGEPLFGEDGVTPTTLLTDLTEMFAGAFALVTNGIAIEGHVAAEPVVLAEQTSWDHSAARADAVRRLLEAADVVPRRIRRVTGHADRKPAARNPMAVRNNRIELILLRSKR